MAAFMYTSGTQHYQWGKANRERYCCTPDKYVRNVKTRPSTIHHNNATHTPTHQPTPSTHPPREAGCAQRHTRLLGRNIFRRGRNKMLRPFFSPEAGKKNEVIFSKIAVGVLVLMVPFDIRISNSRKKQIRHFVIRRRLLFFF